MQEQLPPASRVLVLPQASWALVLPQANWDVVVDINETVSDNFPHINVQNSSDTPEFLQKELLIWAFKYQIPHDPLKALLTILRKTSHQELPKDPRTLLGTPRSADISPMGSGEFRHFNLRASIQRKIKVFNPEGTNLFLTIKVDGLPISLWLKLGYLDETGQSPFVISVFWGLSKPESANVFLRIFLDEMLDIKQTGVFFEGKCFKVRVNIQYLTVRLGHL